MMTRRTFLGAAAASGCLQALPPKTTVSIEEDRFLLNGKPTYAGRSYKGKKIEGLLMNSRMVQGIFDDLNLETRTRWKYPDTHQWDPERNTREFVAAMGDWRRNGLLSFTICLQGGSPQGYSQEQPWENGAFDKNGVLRADSMSRLKFILDRADELGMAPIVSYFYFGQDQRIRDEASVKLAAENATRWILEKNYRHVLVEVANECDVGQYDHNILTPRRIPELITAVKAITHQGRRLLTGTSFKGGSVPTANVVAVSDFVLLHGNGVKDPNRIAEMVRQTRALPDCRPMPILFNEDDHFEFDKPQNNMLAAIGEYASWGYFDPGKSDYVDGYQCPPVNWRINTDRKKAFFRLVKEMTGG